MPALPAHIHLLVSFQSAILYGYHHLLGLCDIWALDLLRCCLAARFHQELECSSQSSCSSEMATWFEFASILLAPSAHLFCDWPYSSGGHCLPLWGPGDFLAFHGPPALLPSLWHSLCNHSITQVTTAWLQVSQGRPGTGFLLLGDSALCFKGERKQSQLSIRLHGKRSSSLTALKIPSHG